MSISQNSRKRKRNENVKSAVNIEDREKRYNSQDEKGRKINRIEDKKIFNYTGLKNIYLCKLIILIKYQAKLITFSYVKKLHKKFTKKLLNEGKNI